jgi:hypothetical protein
LKLVTRVHGDIVRPPDEPALALVHAAGEDARVFRKEMPPSGVFADAAARRMFLVPPGEKGNVDLEIAWAATRLFMTEIYGYLPEWLDAGDLQFAAEDVKCGKPAPTVSRNWAEPFAKFNVTLDRIDSIEDRYERSMHAFAYVLYFRCGPKKVRKAFEEYCRILRTTCDDDAAMGALEVCGFEALRDETRAFLAKRIRYADVGNR